jgi:hypothetical protein
MLSKFTLDQLFAQFQQLLRQDHRDQLVLLAHKVLKVQLDRKVLV